MKVRVTLSWFKLLVLAWVALCFALPTRAAQQAGELVFRQGVRYRRDGGDPGVADGIRFRGVRGDFKNAGGIR